jgi:hypothetical protein
MEQPKARGGSQRAKKKSKARYENLNTIARARVRQVRQEESEKRGMPKMSLHSAWPQAFAFEREWTGPAATAQASQEEEMQ